MTAVVPNAPPRPGPGAVRPFVVHGLVERGRTVLAVTATSREAEDLVEELADLVDPDAVAYYPSWETLPHERLSPRSDTVGARLAVLRRLAHPEEHSEGPLRVVVAARDTPRRAAVGIDHEQMIGAGTGKAGAVVAILQAVDDLQRLGP